MAQSFSLTLLAQSFSLTSLVLNVFGVQGLSMKAGRDSVKREGKPPNILFIVADDLNMAEGFSKFGHPQAHTPFLDKFSESGVVFDNAYSNHPLCSPSRSSFLFGMYGTNSHCMYGCDRASYPVFTESKDLIEYLAENDYKTYGTGKLFDALWYLDGRDDSAWTQYGYHENHGPIPVNRQTGWYTAHPSLKQPVFDLGPWALSFGRFSDLPPENYSGWGYYSDESHMNGKTPWKFVSTSNRDRTPDENNAKFAVERIEFLAQNPDHRPFFLAVGFNRPHVPMHCGDEYFDMFPLETIEPLKKPDFDTSDTFYKMKMLTSWFNTTAEAYGRDEAIKLVTQAYLACVAELDVQIGKVVNALDSTSLKDDTVVIMTSDNAWHLGQKNMFAKPTPWDQANRVPLVIRVPWVPTAGARVSHPVSLIDLYPTIADLCELKGDTMKSSKGHPLDGHSLTPFLKDPKSTTWSGPKGAVSVVPAFQTQRQYGISGIATLQTITARTERYRYIRFPDGNEELYDHSSDPYEWHNIASKPDMEVVKKEHIQILKDELHIDGPWEVFEYGH